MRTPVKKGSGRPGRRHAEVSKPWESKQPGASPAPATGPAYRSAKTRTGTRQVSGHFKPEVAKAVRLLAVEQDKDVQEILAEALTLVFAKYRKTVRVEISSGRRKKAAGG